MSKTNSIDPSHIVLPSIKKLKVIKQESVGIHKSHLFFIVFVARHFFLCFIHPLPLRIYIRFPSPPYSSSKCYHHQTPLSHSFNNNSNRWYPQAKSNSTITSPVCPNKFPLLESPLGFIHLFLSWEKPWTSLCAPGTSCLRVLQVSDNWDWRITTTASQWFGNSTTRATKAKSTRRRA